MCGHNTINYKIMDNISGVVSGGSSSSSSSAVATPSSSTGPSTGPRDPKHGPRGVSKQTLMAYKKRIDKRMKEQQQHGRITNDEIMDGKVGRFASLVSGCLCVLICL